MGVTGIFGILEGDAVELTREKRRLRYLWVANFCILVSCIIGSVLVDSNGRLPGLPERPSLALALAGLATGSVCSAILVVLAGKGWRAVAVVILLVYLMLAVPAMW